VRLVNFPKIFLQLRIIQSCGQKAERFERRLEVQSFVDFALQFLKRDLLLGQTAWFFRLQSNQKKSAISGNDIDPILRLSSATMTNKSRITPSRLKDGGT